MINRQWLLNWLYNQIDMEVSCVEDLEMTEGIKNDYGRGKIAAWEQLLNDILNSESEVNNTFVNSQYTQGFAPLKNIKENRS